MLLDETLARLKGGTRSAQRTTSCTSGDSERVELVQVLERWASRPGQRSRVDGSSRQGVQRQFAAADAREACRGTGSSGNWANATHWIERLVTKSCAHLQKVCRLGRVETVLLVPFQTHVVEVLHVSSQVLR